MANVYEEKTICDVCGCEVYPYHRKSIFAHHYFTRIAFFQGETKDNYRHREHDFDICPECYADILEFIEKKRKETNT